MSSPERGEPPRPRSGSDDHDSDSESGSSHIGSGAPDTPACPYQTSRYFGTECSRYWDCPTHMTEREGSDGVDGGDGRVGADGADGADGEDEEAWEDDPSGSAQSAEDALEASQSPDHRLGEAAQQSFSNMPESSDHPENNSSDASDPAGVEEPALAAARSPGANATSEPSGETESRSAPSQPDSTLDRDRAPMETGITLQEALDQTRGSLGALSIDGEGANDLAATQTQPTTPSDNDGNEPIAEGPAHSGQFTLPQRVPRPDLQAVTLPRWQPDAEATYCPICHTQFSIWVRKHHCRKCGRVVCSACSPHRITIPHQYIVRQPAERNAQRYSFFGVEGGIADFDSISGGERVRLCNPCVPDPNTTPPQTQNSPDALAYPGGRPRRRSQSGSNDNIDGLSSPYYSRQHVPAGALADSFGTIRKRKARTNTA
ncbi:FYVE zinc finger-domain-containing protein [Xylariaceae sp. FL0804]|nr:FYVE zinc finger-domain-containing protein [Xylariaceae sp. FL0804]